MRMELPGPKRLLLPLVPVLMATMILACDLEGLLGGGEPVPNVVKNAPPNNRQVSVGTDYDFLDAARESIL